MPSLGKVLEKFQAQQAKGARVQVSWAGTPTAANQRLVSGQMDGLVQLVDPEGEKTLVLVGENNNVVRMYLNKECTFQDLAFAGNEKVEEAFADMDSGIQIVFPTGERYFVTFFHPAN